MSLSEKYQQLINEGQLNFDDAQSNAIKALELLTQHLSAQPKTKLKSRLSKRSWFKRFSQQQPLKGIYLWGKVGRGKTMMMDLFYQNLMTSKKQRMHFHHFMAQTHQQLAELVGQVNPLSVIAKNLAVDIDVLCFDEFFVSDIGDAMILAGLFAELFNQGVVLVTTSNCQPEQLYRNGLQRQRFLPTIDLLNKYCQVVSVNGEKDHRLHQQKYARYIYPLESSKNFLEEQFYQRTNKGLQSGVLEVNSRELTYLARENNIIYFNFSMLCKGARSQLDYIALAKQFKTVFVANVPQFSGKVLDHVASGTEEGYQRSENIFTGMHSKDDEARRFIALVDEFYDQNIELIISSEVDILNLYYGEKLSFEFARCESRLIEMQSDQYPQLI
ncbi:cell division protein ZapE [Thalassotalea psychrophila]|uniref:Cell division protein ZapE n=1 Tax=Thalassotalea psychrophila TaxID=3065647 RepID=A0ABY9TWV3_9GAMM|nr:cell division protein ZapE [Colwelliaceae bacterium SQ149]